MSTYTPEADTLTEMWATARIAWSDGNLPAYGSQEWAGLNPGNPRRLASALHAAEMWRRYGDEKALLAWFRATTNRGPITVFQGSQYRPAPARPVRATEGWPPVAIPGRPGWYRHLVDGEQTDIPVTTAREEAAA